jgi:hypothetical protein
MQAGDLIWNRFALEQPTAVGGTGQIFRAIDRTTSEAVAIKVLFRRGGPTNVRFEREAQLLLDLRHPGLVRYVAHGVAESGNPFLAMEWLDGEDLGQRLARKPLTVDETLALGEHVADALALVHDRQIVHRDLKPSNLFLVGGKVERTKLLDFGLARLLSGPLTQSGVVLGTLGYVAPEQARSGEPIDSRTDVFALGCVLFECLAGAQPYPGKHLTTVLAKILSEQVPRLRDVGCNVPDDIDNLIASMLARAPSERPRDGASVARAIRELQTSSTQSSGRAPLDAHGAPQLAAADAQVRARGDNAERFLEAAERAHRRCDSRTARALAARGLTKEPTDPVRAGLLGLVCEMAVWEGIEPPAADASSAIRLSAPGSAPWVRATMVQLAHAVRHHRLDDVEATLANIRRIRQTNDAVSAVAFALTAGSFALDLCGRFAASRVARDYLHQIVMPVASLDPAAKGWMLLADTHVISWVQEDPWRSLKLAEAARSAFQRANEPRGVLVSQVCVGANLRCLGQLPAAERVLRGASALGPGLGLSSALRGICLVGVLLERGLTSEAHEEALQMLATWNARSYLTNVGRGRWALAEVLRQTGELDRAEREALAAMDLLEGMPLDRSAATATLARILISKGAFSAALSAANDAIARYSAHGAFGFRGMTAWLARAEALYGIGELESATETIAGIRSRILKRAAQIGDRELRESFVNNVPEHRRALQLASTWLGETRWRGD